MTHIGVVLITSRVAVEALSSHSKGLAGEISACAGNRRGTKTISRHLAMQGSRKREATDVLLFSEIPSFSLLGTEVQNASTK